MQFSSRARRRSNFQLEGLEPRDMKSAMPAPGVALVGSTVQIGGVAGSNIATVYQKDPATLAVVFNGAETDFSRSAVSAIDFEDNGYDSYDVFYNFTDVDSTFHGGNFVNVAEAFGAGGLTASGGGYADIFGDTAGRDDFTSTGDLSVFYTDTGIESAFGPAGYQSS